MQQRFKSIYFADHPSGSTKRRHLKLAFGAGDVDLFHAVSRLSSEEVRNLLGFGSFSALTAGATAERASLNAFCLRRLRQSTPAPRDDAQLNLFPAEIEPRELRFDPIQATYRGGVNEPLHDWYPYLEGYSPEFVKSVIRSFAPTATRVLDPFAGTGTTPLTVARANLRSFYCELNPLLQFLVDTKAKLLTMPRQDRIRLAGRVSRLAGDLPALVASHEPDQRLGSAYDATFGDSVFFPGDTLESCFKLRSLIDAVACRDPILASLTSVAAVASLVPCSNLMRRGDLRFRRGDERKSVIADIAQETGSRLQIMAQDMVRLSTTRNTPLLVAGDAKRLIRVADLGVDAIVTSPPYLNGTNYYRNTKIELWFLRVLLSGRDLASLRRRTVTAGINDVTSDRQSEPVSRSVEEVVRLLDDRAYDRRIPRMVLNYFADMNKVFAALLHHAAAAATLVIDIGDSAYAGVRVDTPQILADLLGAGGWSVNHEITVRQRLSRDGQPLRQVVLAAIAPARKRRLAPTEPWWRSSWIRFQQEIPHQRPPYSKRNWGNPLHSLCSYQGKMKPALAHHLVRTFVRPGDRLLDPFGGVGTIPFEAALHGAATWCFDLSPATIPVAAAKLRPASKDECERLIRELESFIGSNLPTSAEQSDAESIQFNGRLPSYFHMKTFSEILLARRFFQKKPPDAAAAALVFSCLLHVLHGNRPYALSRRSHPITPFAPTGDAEYKSLVDKLTRKIERCFTSERPANFVAGKAMYQDATGIWPQEVDHLDAVITSPPFFDSTRFYLANWMRLWFSGWTSQDFKERPHAFIDERQKQGFEVYQPIIRQARERLKPGGVCVLHLGRSRKCDMAEELAAVAAPWFRNIDVFAESVEHCESHGIRDKGTVVEHTYLVLS